MKKLVILLVVISKLNAQSTSVKKDTIKIKKHKELELFIIGLKNDSLEVGVDYELRTNYEEKCSYLQASVKGGKLTPNGCGKYTLKIPPDYKVEYVEIWGELHYGKKKDYLKSKKVRFHMKHLK